MNNLLFKLNRYLDRTRKNYAYRFGAFYNYTLSGVLSSLIFKLPHELLRYFKGNAAIFAGQLEKRFFVIPKRVRIVLAVIVLAGVGAGIFIGVYKAIPTREERYDYFLQKGRQYYSQGRFPEALIEFNNAIQLAPNSFEGYYHWALTNIYFCRLTEARAALRRCLLLNPKFRAAMLKLNAIQMYVNDPGSKKYDLEIHPTRNSKFTNGRILMSRILILSGDIQSLKAEAKKVYEGDPDSSDVNLIMGDLIFAENNIESAKTYYLRAIAIDEKTFDAHFKLGGFYLYTNDLNNALKEFIAASDISPNNPYIYLIVGDCYAAQKRLNEAIASYKKAHELNRAFIPALRSLCNALVMQGNFGAAGTYVDSFIKIAPKDPAATLLKAIVSFYNGMYAEAIENIKKTLETRSELFMPHLVYARILAKSGIMEDARDEYLKAIKINSNVLDPHVELIDVYFKLNDLNKAEREAEKAMAINPNDFRARIGMGQVLTEKDNLDDAKGLFEKFIKDFPNRVEGYFYLGVVNQRMGNIIAAERNYLKAINMDEGYVKAFSVLIELYLGAKDYEKAAALCNKVLKNNPNNDSAYDALGRIYVILGRDVEAIGFYEKAIDINPARQSSRINLINLYLASDMKINAIYQYQEMLRYMPNNPVIFFKIGNIYSTLGDAEKTIEFYEKGLNIKFDAAYAISLAGIYVQLDRDINKAIDLLLKAEKESNYSPGIVDAAGWVMLKKGMYDEAISRFQNIASSNNPVYKYHLGLALYKKGLFKEALAALNEAVALSDSFGGFEDAQKLIIELKSKDIK